MASLSGKLAKASFGRPLSQRERDRVRGCGLVVSIAPVQASVEKIFGTFKRSDGYVRVLFFNLARDKVRPTT
jgi:hypothetical protein